MLPVVVRPANRSSGFTLVEVMIVIGIIAVLISLAFSTVERRRAAVGIDQAAKDLMARIVEARGLASIAGARIGTARLVSACASNPGAPEIRVWIDPAQNAYEVPKAVRMDNATDQMRVECQRYDLGPLTRGDGRLVAPAGAPMEFTFAATGRVQVVAAPNPQNLFVQVAHRTEPMRSGFRVLPSGVLCSASDPARFGCDEDR